MYIRKVRLTYVKLLRDVSISFMRADEPRLWTVIIGENGLCKSTLLQSIALAASGRDRANQLADIPSLPDVRTPAQAATINAEFSFGTRSHALREYPGLEGEQVTNVPVLESSLEVPPKQRVFRGASRYLDSFDVDNDPILQARARGLHHWFVVGYGVSRRLPMPNFGPTLSDPDYQRLAPLFDKGPIIGTAFADLFKKKTDVLNYVKELQRTLLAHSELVPQINDVELRGRGGTRSSSILIQGYRFSFRAGRSSIKIPATWLSQGYQATIAWIADLVGQQFWDRGSPIAANEMEGLALIDELDLFLHPIWQVSLVQALKKTFPRMQFIVTTHSPMILPGLERDEVLRLVIGDRGNVNVIPSEESPAAMTGTELYESFFGINGLYPTEIGEALRKYSYVSSNPLRTDTEEQEMQNLRVKLAAARMLPEWEPVARRTLNDNH